MNILLIDTSTPLLLVGIQTASRWYEVVEDNGMNHGSLLAPKIKQLCDSAEISLKDLSTIGIVSGPGSFTGLRIGLSTAKGLGEALGIPVAGILNLDALGKTLAARTKPVAAVIDAKKGRMYGRIYDQGIPRAEVFDLSPDDFFHRFKDLDLIVTGPAPDMLFTPEICSPLWTWELCINWLPGMLALTRQAYSRGDFLTPDAGPYYHRMGEEDLGISIKSPK